MRSDSNFSKCSLSNSFSQHVLTNYFPLLLFCSTGGQRISRRWLLNLFGTRASYSNRICLAIATTTRSRWRHYFFTKVAQNHKTSTVVNNPLQHERTNSASDDWLWPRRFFWWRIYHKVILYITFKFISTYRAKLFDWPCLERRSRWRTYSI